MKREDAIQIIKTGATITTSGTSASVAIPTTSDSARMPYYIRISSTVAAYVKIGKGATTAVAGDMLIQPADAVILAVGSCDTVAAIQVSGPGVVQISPMEDF